MSSSGGTKRGKINQIANWLGQAEFEHAAGGDVGRVIEQLDLRAEVDGQLSASANYERIKDEHGLVPKTEFRAFLRDMDEQARRRVRDEIAAQFDEFGVEAVVDAIAGIGDPPTDLQARVEDVLAEVPPDAYDATLQDRIGELLEVLGSDLAVTDADRLRSLEAEARAAIGSGPEAGREDVLAAFSQAFGQRFTDTDEAIRRLRERLERAEERGTTEPAESPSDLADEFITLAEDNGG